MSELLNVGDVVSVTNPLNCEHQYKITRTTKTLAMSKHGDDGYEHTFKRLISGSMAHPKRSYDLNIYKVKRVIHEV